jgi:hypothetical protein
MDVLAAILALQIEQFHDHVIRIRRVNLPLEKHDPVFQQQVPQRQLALTLV